MTSRACFCLWSWYIQPIATDIPSAADLELKTRAEERPGDPPLPPPVRTETVLKRDDWMLMAETIPVVPASSSVDVPMSTNNYSTPGLVQDLGVALQKEIYMMRYVLNSRGSRSV